MQDVTAFDPPQLAVMVAGQRVPVTPNLMPHLKRRDVIVEETRADDESVTYRSVMGIPSTNPLAPVCIQNHLVRQTPLATVDLGAGQHWPVQQLDIHRV